MIRDMFVPRYIKDAYVAKPWSPKEFMINFEIKDFKSLDEDIMDAFSSIYSDSYRSAADVVHIFGGRGTGKSLLCEMIAMYDVFKHVCMSNSGYFNLYVLSDTMKNNVADDLVRLLDEYHIAPFVRLNVVTSQYDLRGRKIDCVIDDGRCLDPHVKELAFTQFSQSLTQPQIRPMHYVMTYEADIPALECVKSGRHLKISLKERKCVSY